MKRVTVLIALVALLVFGFGSFAAQNVEAQGRKGGGPRGAAGEGAPLMGFIGRHLDLTDEQKAEVKKIVDAERTVMQPIHEQMAKNREALKEATKDGQFNETQVSQLAEQQGDLMAQMIVSRERVKSQVYKLLTPEQREKMAAMGDRFEQRRQRPMQGGRRPAQ